MGSYYRNRNNYYPKKIKIPVIQMENLNEITKEKLDIFFKKKTSLYNNYIKNFINFNVNDYSNLFINKKKINLNNFTIKPERKFGHQQIIDYIKKEYKIN
jgi:hypothetical protein